MKAIVLKNFGGVENFTLEDVDMPIVKEGEVLVKIKATAFNPIDYQMRAGATESKLLKSPILGRELSGEIIQIGKNVNTFALGDKVSAYVGSLASNGTYAEYISVPAQMLAKNPVNLTFEQAAATPMVGMTALQCFNRLAIPQDNSVFIAGGAGGVGTILIKLLLEAGNNNIYTTAGNTESIRHLKNIGIAEDNIINYTKESLVPSLRAANNDESFDFVIDLVGNEMSEVSSELGKVFGTYADVTHFLTKKAGETLFDKAATIVNIANYAPASFDTKEKYSYYGILLKELFDRFEKNIISPAEVNIIGGLNLETVKKAHAMMEQNQARGKKLVMCIA